MTLLVAAPVLLPLMTAVAGLLAPRSRGVQRAIGALGAAALAAATLALTAAVDAWGPATVRLGDWPAPFGITWVADRFGAVMAALAGLIGLASVVYALFTADEGAERFGFYPLVHVLLAGVCGAFLTGDLFNLFVWFEVMLIASFVLVALGGGREQMEGAIKYVGLNLVGSAVFLSAVGLLYGLTGTLDFADLAVRVRGLDPSAPVGAVAMLLLVAFGLKAAVFPLFFWLPPSYPTLPPALAALFAGLLTKVGVYALIRVFTLLFAEAPAYGRPLLLAVAVATMAVGVLGALAQNDLRRILSFHIVSQIGYMVLGLGISTTLALAGSVFYIGHHMVVKANLFLIGGLVRRAGGSYRLDGLGGLASARPALALLFLVPALSLAGLPPLSGFFAKLALLRAGVEAGASVAVAVALAVSLLTLVSMMKIWTRAFWGAEAPRRPAGGAGPYVPAIGLALLTIALGLLGGPFMAYALRTADDLSHPGRYVAAVLGSDAW